MHAFEQKLIESWPPAQWCDLTVVVSVSGGADSVALLRGLAAIRGGREGGLIVAHFNHKLRGAESDADEAFVEELCRQLSLPCETGHPEQSLSDLGGDGLEAAARNSRYAFLKRIAHQTGARFIATGHTADDQAETILHHILRGTGLSGLAGMQQARMMTPTVTLIRPLLEICRAQVLEYLSQLNQPHRTDDSNTDDRFTRNRIRHRLLPLLAREFNEQVVESLLRLGTLANDAQSVIEKMAEGVLAARLKSGENGSLSVDCDGLAAEPAYLICEVMKAFWRWQRWPQQSMTHRHWCDLAELATSPSTSQSLTMPGAIQVTSSAGSLWFSREI